MTAAPGPQQPDEVLANIAAMHVPYDDPYSGRLCAHDEFRWPCETAKLLRAAPSAQPDRSLSQQRRLAVQDAQSVRDIEEGRR